MRGGRKEKQVSERRGRNAEEKNEGMESRMKKQRWKNDEIL